MKANRRLMLVSIVLLVSVSLFISACEAPSKTGTTTQDPEIPEFTTDTGWVIDTTGELDSNIESLLEAEAQAMADDGYETAIVIFKNCNNCNQVLFAAKIGDENGIGDEESDNGIVIVVFTEIEGDDGNTPYIAIATGRGTEGVLGDAKAGRVIRSVFAPKRAEGEWQQGLLDFTVAIHQVVVGEKTAQDFSEPEVGLSLWEIFLFLLLVTILIMVISILSQGGSGTSGTGSSWSSSSSGGGGSGITSLGGGGSFGGGGSGG